MTRMDITVIVCTFNRVSNLSACIERLTAQRGISKLRWEVLVVDNNSRDNTAEAVRRLQDLHPGYLRYIFEPEQGVAHARNRGIQESDSRYIAYVDDDIRVVPDWLAAIAETFSQTGCDAIAGRILVESPKPLPAWIAPNMMGFLGQLDYGDESLAIDGIEDFPFAGNMAFSRDIVARIGAFDGTLGRRGSPERCNGLYKGEEPDFFARLARAGGDIRYEPRAAATHHILPYQLTRRFFLTIHYNEGYQRVRDLPSPQGRTLKGVPLYLYRQGIRALVRYLGKTTLRGPNSTVRDLMTVAHFAGTIRGYQDKKENGLRP